MSYGNINIDMGNILMDLPFFPAFSMEIWSANRNSWIEAGIRHDAFVGRFLLRKKKHWSRPNRVFVWDLISFFHAQLDVKKSRGSCIAIEIDMSIHSFGLLHHRFSEILQRLNSFSEAQVNSLFHYWNCVKSFFYEVVKIFKSARYFCLIRRLQ